MVDLSFPSGGPFEEMGGKFTKRRVNTRILTREKTERGSRAVRENRSKFSSHLSHAIATKRNNPRFLPWAADGLEQRFSIS